jgi:YVTN family beta-propeller protein
MQANRYFYIRAVCLACVFGLALVPIPTQAQQFAYVTNSQSDSVSVIDTTTHTVVATIAGIGRPIGVAVTPNGSRVYVTDTENYFVTVIDAATNTAFASIAVGPLPWALVVSPDGSRV